MAGSISAVVAYIPLLLSSPGRVGADTKTYLYLDPGRLLRDASSLWDSDVALGTVTHQTIGYLWPMGPFYWVLENVGLPDWISQRLWLGSILLGAGLGVRYLLRTLGWSGPGLLLAMLAYQLSPYLLDYSARISVVLLPWAGLPWLMGLIIRSARGHGWRHPALFALVVVTIGSVNATSLVLVGLGPVLWLAHAVWVDRSVPARDAVSTVVRVGALTVGVNLWWVAGLYVQGGYSLPVTRYTETYEVVADAATAPEILRGLGYWFFYGNDKFGPWIEPSVDYTQGVWLIFVSFGLVVVALTAAAVVRWRHRGFFVLLLVVGALTAVGSHPFDSPSPMGRLFKEFTRSDAGLAMRSTPRAVPLVALAVAVLLGSGLNALARSWPRWWRPLGALLLVAVVLNNPPMWKTRMIERHLDRAETLPDYWPRAIAALDDGSPTRVWEVPGSDFASYRWGNTVDPITPGLMDRGFVARELVPFGSARSAALLTAIDRRMQEGTLDVDSVGPIARLMSVGDVVHRADLTYERFRTPRPIELDRLLQRAGGLVETTGFGDATPNRAGPEQTLRDEIFLAADPDAPWPRPLTRFEVEDPLPVVRARPVAAPTVVVGDADGIIDAAGAGVLDLDRTIVFAADLVAEPELYQPVLSQPLEVVLTDTNRRRARRWGTIREVYGYTETAGSDPLVDDPTDNRLPVFGDVTDEARTVSEHRGAVTVVASAYGNPVTYTPDDRPVHAVDGDPATAWSVAAFAEARGERIVLRLDDASHVRNMRLVQPLPSESANRRITEIELTLDGSRAGRTELDDRSLTETGQLIPIDRTVHEIEIEITDTTVPRRATYPGVSPVGFAEIDLGLGAVEEVIRTPRAFVEQLGPDLDRHRLAVVLTRVRSNPREPVREDPEPLMTRAVTLPVERRFELHGTARLSSRADPTVVDRLIGWTTGLDGVGLAVRASDRLAGDLPSRPAAAFDGDLSTAWTARFGPQAGQWIEIDRDRPIAVDHVELDIVADRLHSVPSTVRVTVDGLDHGAFETGLDLQDAEPDTTRPVTVPIPSGGRTVRLTFETVDERFTKDWYSNELTAMPISVAEIRADPGARFGDLKPIDTGCRSDLVTVDGAPVAVAVTGPPDAALSGEGLELVGCEPVEVGAGEFLLETAAGPDTGIDLDQIVLRSDRPVPAPARSPAPDADWHSDTQVSVAIPPAGHDRWLVLGQSDNDGWKASADGRDLGPARVVDGFANAWLIPAGDGLTVDLEWTPQRIVDRSLRISLLFVLLALLVVWRGRGSSPVTSRSLIDEPDQPQLGPLPFASAGPAPLSRGAALSAGAVAGGLALLNLPRWPILAAAIGLLVAVVASRRRAAGSLVLAAAGSLGVAALYVMAEQTRLRHPPDFVWPQQFEEVHILGVLTILLLASEYVLVATRARTALRRSEPGSSPG